MKISVVIPTYKRLNDLKRCLTALDNQVSLPHEVIVVVKSYDSETLSFVMGWILEQTIYGRRYDAVANHGVVQAMIRGVDLASGEVIAFTDDDSAPDPTWLLKMKHHYQNPKVGGVGGRDILVDKPVAPLRTEVGKLTWYGKLIGNHHLGDGPPREVDVLKGVNMSFRKQLVEFSPFLRGSGGAPETHNEVGLCLRVTHLGYSLVYDPEIKVNHYASPRVGAKRNQFNSGYVKNSAFNIQMSLMTWLPWHQKLLRVLYSILVGDSGYPGFMRFFVALARYEVGVVKSYFPAQVGFLIAVMHYCRWTFSTGSNAVITSETITQHKATAKDV